MYKFDYTGIPHELKIWIGMFISHENDQIRIAKINILIGYLRNLKPDHLSIL